ncbi:MAG: PQQ-binding-like beta-propeller repeat protein [Gemmatimonadales bacterium]
MRRSISSFLTVLTIPTSPRGWDLWASSPTVVGSRMLIGAGDGKLYCLDLLTGKRLWQARTGGRVRATPAVQNGIVVVGSWTGGCTPNL